MNQFQGYFTRRILILAMIWAIVQAFLLVTYGIKTDGEALRVIREANNLHLGIGLSTPLYFTYLTEIILVLIKLKLGTGFGLVICTHLALNLVALLFFFRFLVHIYSSEKIAFAGSLLLLLCIPFQLYNTFIYTESIFFSLCIIYSCRLLSTKEFSVVNIYKLVLLLILLCITRPTGLFFVAATALYVFAHWKLKGILKYSLFFVLVAIGLLIINYLMGSGDGIDVLIPLREEHIICEVPSANVVTTTQNNEGNSIYGLLSYIGQHPGQFLRLAWLKSIAFFGLVRTFYSTMHNLLLAGFFYSLYLLIVYGLFKRGKVFSGMFLYCFSVVIIFWMAVIFSCDEWHNRFFLTLTPFLIIAALAGFSNNKGDKKH